MNTIIQPREADLPRTSQQRVLDLVLKEDDLNWKDVIHNLVREENMDPWDLDVSLLSDKFIEMMNTLKEMDFRIGGKMVLTSSLLLKIKSDNLMNDGFSALDSLIQGEEEFLDEDMLESDGFEFEQTDINQFLNDERKLVPRTPQPRERKVSVFDLVNALENALTVDMRRKFNINRSEREKEIEAKGKSSFDLASAMQSIQSNISKKFMSKETTILFRDLLPENPAKLDLVYTFLPLLHLETQRKVNLHQDESFGPIGVTIFNREL